MFFPSISVEVDFSACTLLLSFDAISVAFSICTIFDLLAFEMVKLFLKGCDSLAQRHWIVVSHSNSAIVMSTKLGHFHF